MRTRLAILPAGTMPRSTEKAWLGAIDGLLATIQEETGSPAYHDYAVGSPVLSALAAAEPVSGIEYFTFGGTSPLLMRLGGWAFTPLSAVPLPHWPPFHWETVHTSLLALPPVLPMAPPELTYGVGDILVAAPRAHLPFSTRFNNPLNHAQVLWNKGVKTQVMAILRGEMVHQSSPIEQKLPEEARDHVDPARYKDGPRSDHRRLLRASRRRATLGADGSGSASAHAPRPPVLHPDTAGR